MRLLEYGDGNDNFKLTDDLDRDIPSYAILSHTWSENIEDEVTFQDLVFDTGKNKSGYDKIDFCAAQAKHDGLRYFWVDTCCIDKSNKAELANAIDSMFLWYQNAMRCYVYLSDVPASSNKDDNHQFTWETDFRKSRWFTRGWTLQELLAPVSVDFFNKGRERLGDKTSLEQQIHETTGIAIPALRFGGRNLAQFSVKERFQWAAIRKTTHEEDWAYCLQGIFGVRIPVAYGEGKEAAIHQLKKEINGIFFSLLSSCLSPLVN